MSRPGSQLDISLGALRPFRSDNACVLLKVEYIHSLLFLSSIVDVCGWVCSALIYYPRMAIFCAEFSFAYPSSVAVKLLHVVPKFHLLLRPALYPDQPNFGIYFDVAGCNVLSFWTDHYIASSTGASACERRWIEMIPSGVHMQARPLLHEYAVLRGFLCVWVWQEPSLSPPGWLE
jgi:hypothetical protein